MARPSTLTALLLIGAVLTGGYAHGQALKIKDLRFYEVNIRAFSADGNLHGVTEKLDTIKQLGVNVVWLMPIFPVGKLHSAGGLGSPYSVADYDRVNPEFGTLRDLKTLVDQAHAKRMYVVLDWVANHTSWDNPWMIHPEWYRHDDKGAIIIPPTTNWQDVAQLDHRNATMRDAMVKSMDFWVREAHVDGFRCDAADFVPAPFWKKLIASVRSHTGKPLIFLGEGGRDDHYESGFDLLYGWNYCTALIDVFSKGRPASHLAEVLDQEADHPKMHYTTNHDNYAWDNSPVDVYGGAVGSGAAFALAALEGGTPLVYDGQEIGVPTKIPFFVHEPIAWPDSSSLRDTYVRILTHLRTNPELRHGVRKDYSSDDVAAFTRSIGASAFLVLINVRNHPTRYVIPDALASHIQQPKWAGSITLDPYEVKVLPASLNLATPDPQPVKQPGR